MDLGDPMMSVKKMKAIFRKYDTDGDGTISRGDLEKILRKLIPGISQIDLDLIFRKIDKNFNNLVEYDEFVNLLFFDPIAEPVRTPAHHVTREAAYVIFLFWQQASRATPWSAMVHSMDVHALLGAVEHRSKALDAVCHRIQRLEGEIFDLVSKVEEKMISRICSSEVKHKLHESEREVDQETFVKMVWPRIKRFDLKFVLGCLRRFWAQESLMSILREVARQKEAGRENPEVGINVAEMKKIFDVLDEDDDGALSIKEMVQQGNLEVKDALYFSELLDKGQDGEVSLQELMNLVVGNGSGEVMETMKGLFAARASLAEGGR